MVTFLIYSIYNRVSELKGDALYVMNVHRSTACVCPLSAVEHKGAWFIEDLATRVLQESDSVEN